MEKKKDKKEMSFRDEIIFALVRILLLPFTLFWKAFEVLEEIEKDMRDAYDKRYPEGNSDD
ncbi:hypothetical protein [Jiulongibacter sediminis]|uniref:Uncharacterized protein n=1 Tax=Jiulongibacter sediminis TaxID=1605367 RepID=A0A0P7C6Q5_9BACT|nr:hypothetical protein [Jiulongibacter sediminis]KPM50023.1 hypothetical protein AFM12_05595 [Jiulongibacter sediminis]TBX27051.1 hypothetical protein TK44_05600 [Jiulongibacter sediminis]